MIPETGSTSELSPSTGKLNVLMLYDQHIVGVNTVRDYLDCFALYSRHKVWFVHAARNAPLRIDLDEFDVLLVHYSVRIGLGWHLSPAFAPAISRFRGLKALFIQDEYDTPDIACRAIEELGIRVVFTCVPEPYVYKVYA